ncbi:hypothetical protein BKA57DRAFT_445302 [Linnemannia elongata]|nr:hypothetical protein BKA57DRAFT_445302 [Linnemannia elongata]
MLSTLLSPFPSGMTPKALSSALFSVLIMSPALRLTLSRVLGWMTSSALFVSLIFCSFKGALGSLLAAASEVLASVIVRTS